MKSLKLNNDFIKSVATLVTGTILAQIVVFALSPIISRLYSPEETAYFSVYARIIILASTLATARFEFALALPKRNEHAFTLYRLIVRLVLISFIISILISCFYVLFGLKNIKDSFIYFMIPVGLVPLCMMNIGNAWSMRQGQFKEISKLRMVHSISMNLSNVLFGVLGFGYQGLILGYVVGVSIPGAWFTKKYHLLKLKYKDFTNINRRKIIRSTYIDFPKVNLPHALTDMIRELLIVFFILLFYNKSVLGSYDFSFKMLKLPLTIIGSAIGQVYFQKIAIKRNNGESLSKITLQTIKNLFLLSVIPFSILFFYGQELFCYVFGKNWELAGKYSEIMAPWLMMNLIVSPISHLPAVIGKLKSFFWVGFLGSVLAIGLFLFPYFNNNLDFMLLLKYINYSQTIFLFFVLIWFMRLSKK